MRAMLERPVRRPRAGATDDAADGTVDQPGVEVLMPEEAIHDSWPCRGHSLTGGRTAPT